MAPSLMSLHVASHTKSLSTAMMWALEGLFSGVAMAMNPEAARPGERLTASWADITILALWECSL